MKVEELKKFLNQHNIVPAKTLGQNYLINEHVFQKIINAGAIEKTDRVIEIGAGFGNLTELLLAKSNRVIVFETDPRSIKILQDLQKQNPHLSVIASDVTTYPIDNLIQDAYTIISNLPYNITSWVLEHFLTPQCARAVFLVQKEVALRVCAKQGEMSMLSLWVQCFGTPRILGFVPPSAFYPKPKVTSAILKIDRVRPFKVRPCQAIMQVGKIGFASKRKKLLNNLSSGLKKNKETLKNIFVKANISLDARAEELGVEDWKKLVDVLHKEVV